MLEVRQNVNHMYMYVSLTKKTAEVYAHINENATRKLAKSRGAIWCVSNQLLCSAPPMVIAEGRNPIFHPETIAGVSAINDLWKKAACPSS